MSAGRHDGGWFGWWSKGDQAKVAAVAAFGTIVGVAASPLVGLLIWVFGTLAAWPDVQHYQSRMRAVPRDQIERAQTIGVFREVRKQMTGADFTFGHAPHLMSADEATVWPPTRVSGWWAGFAALIAGLATVVVSPVRPFAGYPILVLPVGIHAAVNAAAIYVTVHVWAKWRRHNPWVPRKETHATWGDVREFVDAEPAVTVAAAIPAGLIVGLAVARFSLGWVAVVVATVVAAVVGAAAVVSIRLTQPDREGHDDAAADQAAWQQMWVEIGGTKLPAPLYGRRDDIRDAQGRVLYTLRSFNAAPGKTWADYATHADGVALRRGVPFVSIYQMPRQAATMFLVATPTPDQQMDELFDPQCRPAMMEFLGRGVFASLWPDMKVEPPRLVEARSMVSRRSRDPLVYFRFDLPGSTALSAAKLAQNADVVARHIGAVCPNACVSWVAAGIDPRVSGETTESTSTSAVIIAGANPKNLSDSFAGAAQRTLASSLQWSAAWRANKVTSPAGDTPQLLEVRETPRGIYEMDFELPGSVSVETVKASLDGMRTSMGWAYIAPYSRDAAPDENLSQMLSLYVGSEDPLSRPYLFNDYIDQMILGPSPDGSVNMKFAVGPGPNGELVTYNLADKDLPHLLLMGATGKGKSVLGEVIYYQLLANNRPEDVQFVLVEPKSDLFEFAPFRHTIAMIREDPLSDEHIVIPAAAAAAKIAQVMRRRNAIFNSHPARPKNLNVARQIADTEDPERLGHPLRMPYIVMIVEECADLYEEIAAPKKVASTGDPARDKEAAARFEAASLRQYAWAQWSSDMMLLSRKARSAGIHLIHITQRPTKNAVPPVIKGQSGRLGLGVADLVSSLVAIDEGGLEKIDEKGRGMMKQGGKLNPFRGFFLRSSADIARERSGSDRGMSPEPVVGDAQQIRAIIPQWEDGWPPDGLIDAHIADLDTRLAQLLGDPTAPQKLAESDDAPPIPASVLRRWRMSVRDDGTVPAEIEAEFDAAFGAADTDEYVDAF